VGGLLEDYFTWQSCSSWGKINATTQSIFLKLSFYVLLLARFVAFQCKVSWFSRWFKCFAGWNNLIHRFLSEIGKNIYIPLHSFSLSILASFSTAFFLSLFLPLCALSFFLPSSHYPCSLSYNLSPCSCLSRIPTCASFFLIQTFAYPSFCIFYSFSSRPLPVLYLVCS